MPAPRRPRTLADLDLLDDDTRAELIDGVIYDRPVTTFVHGHIAALLVMELGPPFQLGRGRPGDWWIQGENDFVAHRADRFRPDALGWRKDRLVDPPAGRRVEVVPDWVCEILSPSDRPYKQRIKRTAYARVGVKHRWHFAPTARTLYVFELDRGAWIGRAVFCDDEVLEAPPFYEVTDTVPGTSMTLRDLVEGTVVTVNERSASREVARHSCLAARVLPRGYTGGRSERASRSSTTPRSPRTVRVAPAIRRPTQRSASPPRSSPRGGT